MKTADYLNAVKAKLNITSDYALAKALKISKQTASKYANNENVPGPVVAFRVAEILGEQPAAVVAVFEAERSERAGNTDEMEEFRGWAKRLGGTAASILLALGLGGISNADARLAAHAENQQDIHRIPKRKRRGQRNSWFAGLMPMAMA